MVLYKSLFYSFSFAHVSLLRQQAIRNGLENYKQSFLFNKQLTLRQLSRAISTSKHTLRNSAVQLKSAGRNMAGYTAVEKGNPNSTNYAVYLKNAEGHAVSPLHDIPLYANKEKTILNMVVEIPRWTNAKMEISLSTPLNPIKQDIKKGKLRFVANCFPHKGYIWNYGAFPQTWENPSHVEPTTGCKGDNDPIDVCEIGYRVAKRGEVIQVKVLGTVALIDEGETDWKILAIDVNDPLAEKLNDVADIEQHCPGLLRATVEWFKIYKMPDGKPENQFAFNGDPKPAVFANEIIKETHTFWESLINDKSEGNSISRLNSTLTNTSHYVSPAEADKILSNAAEGGEVQEISDAGERLIYNILPRHHL